MNGLELETHGTGSSRQVIENVLTAGYRISQLLMPDPGRPPE
jgi:hypothetical protein